MHRHGPSLSQTPNLLLSDDAQIDTKPQLEIHADRSIVVRKKGKEHCLAFLITERPPPYADIRSRPIPCPEQGSVANPSRI